LPVVLALVGLGGASCRSTPTDCKHDSTERCLWEAGVAPPTPTQNDPNPNGEDDLGDDGVASELTRLDETLGEMVSIIGAGLEWSLVDERARTLCSDTPNAPELGPDMPPPTPDAWTCAIRGLGLEDQELELEASNGVLSLSAMDIDDTNSAELFELAQRRFAGWCAGEVLREVEGEGLAEFYRCSLPEGPYLVIARFPRDPKATLWQVSIAIVDAG
jgi:hypothetical protein